MVKPAVSERPLASSTVIEKSKLPARRALPSIETTSPAGVKAIPSGSSPSLLQVSGLASGLPSALATAMSWP